MKRLPALFIAAAILLFPWAITAYAEETYEPPYPHSTGAQLLPLCQDQDAPVELLRCDYYVQGIADLATTPVQGERLACIPRGKNRTELMAFAVEHLTSLKPDVLENSSAASLILQALQKEFRCPETKKEGKQKKKVDPVLAEALRKAFEKQAREKKAGEAGKQ
jgi:hypothetical protein